MLRFACLRIPRRHLLLLLARMLERRVELELGDVPMSLMALTVAAVRGFCFHEVTPDEMRRAEGQLWDWELNGGEPVEDIHLNAAQSVLTVGAWPRAEPEPGLSWGVEYSPHQFVLAVEASARELRHARAADEVRRTLAYPSSVARDWRPELPLVFSGEQALTVSGWELLHAAPLDAPFDVPPDILVLRDQLLASRGPEIAAQAEARARVQAIIERRGTPAPVVPKALVTHLQVPGSRHSHEDTLRVMLAAAFALPLILLAGVVLRDVPLAPWIFAAGAVAVLIGFIFLSRWRAKE